MGCFLACFSACKHRKRRHLVTETPSKHHGDGVSEEALQLHESTKQDVTEEPIKPISEAKEKIGDEELSSNEKKKVTFDLNVKTYEALSNEEEESEKKEEPSNESKSIYPTSHRYKTCETEEFDDLDLEYNLDTDDDDDDSNEGGDDKVLVQEESSESLFSLSIDSRKQLCGAELGEKEVTSPMPKCGLPDEELKAVGSNPNARDNSKFVDSMLNPIENMVQSQVVKTKITSPLRHQDKENVNLEQGSDIGISQEPSFKLMKNNLEENSNQKKLVKQEIAVDTSLSSWLVESEATPMFKTSANSLGNSPSGSGSSPRSREDRPILGALTINELKQLSASTSSRRTKNQSPDETPIIGTVGSYWIHTGRTVDSDSGSSSKGMPNTRSNIGEDERMKWNSTPFEERLERALARGTAQV